MSRLLQDDQRSPASLDATQPEPRFAEIDAQTVAADLRRRNTTGCDLAQNPFPDVCELPDSQAKLLIAKPCGVCGETRAQRKYAVDGTRFDLVVCQECGTGRLHPFPRPQEILSFYPPAYYGTPGAKFVPGIEHLVRFLTRQRAARLMRGIPVGARVLDVGCGRGVLLTALADMAIQAYGFDISKAAVAGADPRARIQVADDLAHVEYPAAYFDCVVLWHVLEHLPDPRRTLAEVARILKPGGRLIVAVPNFSSRQAQWAGSDWFHLDLPRHLYHFTEESLERLLTASGFTCKSTGHFSLRQNPFGWVQSRLNRTRQYPRNCLYKLLHRSENSRVGLGARLRQRLAYLSGMPGGLLLSLRDAWTRTGATICVTARRARTPAVQATESEGRPETVSAEA